MTEINGSCLCGKVTCHSSAEPLMAGHCHCINCRKASLTGHASFMALPRNSVHVEGETSAYSYTADSGNVVTRHFCPACGSPVLNENEGMPDMVMLPGSILDDPELFHPQFVVYASRATSWDQPAEGVPTFDTMPPQQ